MPDDQSVPEELDPLKLFPQEMHRAVEGVAFLGQLVDPDIVFCGHRFGLRTLRPAYKAAIGVAIQPYRNTLYEVDMFQGMTVGVALTHVDDDQDFCPPIGPDLESFAKARWNYVSNAEHGWYDPTLAFLFERYMLMEAASLRLVQELDRLSRGSQPSSLPPWLDSLTAPGRSPEPTSSDTPPSTPSK